MSAESDLVVGLKEFQGYTLDAEIAFQQKYIEKISGTPYHSMLKSEEEYLEILKHVRKQNETSISNPQEP